ncbi:hypothetical protein [Leeuwenhoekiella marinoflava]|uniref:Uncharacterized protein n=2 Tax=Leeuwenhoekiella marinoflava TaxID=988 RepID=A0A4Q0PM10_9FLAO|nr:hypothetical protein [Leeuwenhoekiella marinoflava]RXG28369.1 hypothetical protein DSL99_2370 [Leeuwenhoekiella marinoflava]SHF50168.1 hypothetical protein SAMN02745246_02661 [Leeuwenhoekiella marinoflava DSM 3653]
MKTKKLLNQLMELKETHIELINDSRNRNQTCGLASNYSELIHRIADLLKTSKKALEGMHCLPETNPTKIEYNVADVIGIAIKLLPFSEMQFIDKTMELLSEESSMNTEH